MKTIIKTTIVSLLMGLLVVSCSSNKEALVQVKKGVQAKSGVQLWGENCVRCHNIPSPAAFNDVDWSTIEMHMKVRANLTKVESEKIFEFIRSAN